MFEGGEKNVTKNKVLAYKELVSLRLPWETRRDRGAWVVVVTRLVGEGVRIEGEVVGGEKIFEEKAEGLRGIVDNFL